MVARMPTCNPESEPGRIAFREITKDAEVSIARFSNEQLANIAKKLLDMPEQAVGKQHSKQDAVRVLSKEISTLQSRGYTMEAIATTLSAQGFRITPGTLKSYVRRAKAAVKNGAPKVTPPRKQRKHAEDDPAPTANTRKAEIQAPIVRISRETNAIREATFTPKPDTDLI